MGIGIRVRRALDGDSAGSLDNIDGDVLSDNDFSLTMESGEFYVHYVDIDSGLSEDIPVIITPASNPGNKRHILCDLKVNNLTYYGYIQNNGTPQSISGESEINATTPYTNFQATGVNSLTIANGTFDNQQKTVKMVSGESEVNCGILSGPNVAATSIVFGHDGAACLLGWDDATAKWYYVGGGAQYTS